MHDRGDRGNHDSLGSQGGHNRHGMGAAQMMKIFDSGRFQPHEQWVDVRLGLPQSRSPALSVTYFLWLQLQWLVSLHPWEWQGLCP